MKLKELVDCLTKYYVIAITDDLTYEDQTVVPQSKLQEEVNTVDFYEDDGEGEMLLVNLKG